MPAVKWLPGAIADLNRCFDFLNARNPQAAQSALKAIIEAGYSLADYPERCPRLASAPHQRKLKVDWGKYGYSIRFRIEEDTVYILAVKHGRENRQT
jgi:plasmid stabilization system protein ParE